MADMDKLVVRDLRDQSTSEYDIKDSAARQELSNVKADLRVNQSALSQEIARATAEDERLEKLFSAPTQEAVDNWLNAHPEATTTVQDGSITYKKLNADVKAEFNAINSDVMTNLFKPLLYHRTINGVTFTLNDADNTYTVQGTSTSVVYDTIGIISLEPGTYKLLGLVQSGSATTWRINLYATGSGSLIAQDLGLGEVFTVSEAVTCRLVLYINSGITIDIDFKPMITASLNATIENYVPYNGAANQLNKNVSALSYDLYRSTLTGDKIHNDNVGWMVDIAKTWLDNASKIWYSYDGNLFYDEVIETDGKYPMTCSVFVSAMIFGISFYNSKYNGKTANSYNNFAYSDQTLLALLRNGNFSSELMLSYFIKKGYAFIPEPDLSNVEMGDILYVDLNQTTETTFHDISHSAIFAYRLNSAQYRVWEVGGNAGPVQMAYTFDYAREKVKFAVRLPFKTWQTNTRRVTLSTAEFTAATPLTSLFDFNYNFVANMWKVTLLGTAYGAGGDQSSIYLLRTNYAGAISAKTKLFEGTGVACRKLDVNNAIYDSEGKYDQPVTVVVEWLGS